METNQKVGRIELDRTRLLGFDRASALPRPGIPLAAKVGEKLLDVRFAAMVGSKPVRVAQDVGLAFLTKVGFKDTFRP